MKVDLNNPNVLIVGCGVIIALQIIMLVFGKLFGLAADRLPHDLHQPSGSCAGVVLDKEANAVRAYTLFLKPFESMTKSQVEPRTSMSVNGIADKASVVIVCDGKKGDADAFMVDARRGAISHVLFAGSLLRVLTVDKVSSSSDDDASGADNGLWDLVIGAAKHVEAVGVMPITMVTVTPAVIAGSRSKDDDKGLVVCCFLGLKLPTLPT